MFPIPTREGLPRRRWLLRAVLATVVLGCLVAGTWTALGYERVHLGPGAVDEPAEGTTIVSAQGFQFAGGATGKKPARLVGLGPNATVEWERLGDRTGAWFYDVEPLAGGRVLVSSPVAGETRVFAYDPTAGAKDWQVRLEAEDTHDVELLPNGRLLVANMRAWNGTAGHSDDRLFVYDRHNETVEWEWLFRDHYPNDTDGGMTEDWTHVNDVERVAPGEYLASPRNFDQVILVNRSTGTVEWRLGADDRHDVLFEQHNPESLVGPDGQPTVLVADSENDRVVEYERGANGSWTEVWSVTGFNWPRDADRLPDGNTLIVDSLNHRVVEVTPDGEVVWEGYVPWSTYDADRRVPGEAGPATGSSGPTMRALGAGGTQVVHGGAGAGPGGSRTPGDLLVALGEGSPLEDQFLALGRTYTHVVPWFRPVWLAPWAFAAYGLAAVVALGWALGEAVYSRRVRRRLAGLRERAALRERFGRARNRLSGDVGERDANADREDQ